MCPADLIAVLRVGGTCLFVAVQRHELFDPHVKVGAEQASSVPTLFKSPMQTHTYHPEICELISAKMGTLLRDLALVP